MARVWADEQKYEYWRRVEVAVCEAWAEQAVIPADALPAIRAATFDLKRIDEIFSETRHDVIAFVRSMAETEQPASRDAFAALARRPDAMMAQAMADVQSLLRGPAIQARCLECAVAAPAPVRATTVRQGSLLSRLLAAFW